MADFYLKQHDLLPRISATLTDSQGLAVDLTTATGVVFTMVTKPGLAIKINKAAAVITNAAAGIVTYSWAGTDTDTAGDFYAEFKATFPTTKPETFPNTTNLVVTITPNLS